MTSSYSAHLFISIPQDRPVKVIYICLEKTASNMVLKYDQYDLGAKLWNTLPLELRNAPSKALFKTKLKIYLLTKVDR